MIDCPKIEEDQKLEDHIIKNSKLLTDIWVDLPVKELPVGAFVQFERRCYARLDKKYFEKDGSLVMHFIFVPDGKSKGMSNIKNKVDAAKFTKGGESTKEATPAQEKKPKADKKIDESVKAQKMKEKAEKQHQEKSEKDDQPKEGKSEQDTEAPKETKDAAATDK